MNWNCTRISIVVVATLFPVPCSAQFEITPDHFDDSPAIIGAKTTKVRQQIAALQAKLESYRQRIASKTAEVEKTELLVISSARKTNKLDASLALADRQGELKKLWLSLAAPIRSAELQIAKLQHDPTVLPSVTIRPTVVGHPSLQRTGSKYTAGQEGR